MLMNALIVLGTISDRRSSAPGLLASAYILALLPFAITPLSLVYFLILKKKRPVKAKGVLVSLIVTFAMAILAYMYGRTV